MSVVPKSALLGLLVGGTMLCGAMGSPELRLEGIFLTILCSSKLRFQGSSWHFADLGVGMTVCGAVTNFLCVLPVEYKANGVVWPL